MKLSSYLPVNDIGRRHVVNAPGNPLDYFQPLWPTQRRTLPYIIWEKQRNIIAGNVCSVHMHMWKVEKWYTYVQYMYLPNIYRPKLPLLMYSYTRILSAPSPQLAINRRTFGCRLNFPITSTSLVKKLTIGPERLASGLSFFTAIVLSHNPRHRNPGKLPYR